MDNALAARRISAALGRKVRPEDVQQVHGQYVLLNTGEHVALFAGNVAYLGRGKWVKNGRPWDDPTPRPLT